MVSCLSLISGILHRCLLSRKARFLLILLVFLTQTCASANVEQRPRRVQDLDESPDGMNTVQDTSGTHTVRLEIGLKQGRFNELERCLYEVSDPVHASYGQYLTSTEVDELVRPSEEVLLAVESWLQEHNITSHQFQYNHAKDWLALDLSTETVERLLDTKFTQYYHVSSKRYIETAREWSVPEKLNGHIDSIHASNTFMYAPGSIIDFPRSMAAEEQDSYAEVTPPIGGGLNQVAESASGDLNFGLDLDNLPDDLDVAHACNISAVTPLCVRLLYGTLRYETKASTGNSMALVNFNGQFNNRSDVDLFLKQHRPDAARAHAAFTFTEDNLYGATNQQAPVTPDQMARKVGREGNLDAQVLLSIAYPTPLITYSVPPTLRPPFIPDLYTPTNTNEPFLSWLHHVLALPDSALPKVIAISYGDIEQTVPYGYAKRVCDSFAQLGARGVTVIFGAGDSGVGKSGYCHSNGDSNATVFLTSFPASCPYGTSVGATRQLLPNGNTDGGKSLRMKEVPAHNERNGFVTGGGFSRYFPRPRYQEKAVEAYLKTKKLDGQNGDAKYAGLFNSNGRAYPDVSISGYRRAMTWYGKNYLVDGTSASAPTFGAVVALVNDALLAEGKPSLGFLNPWLYSEGWKAFEDVTEGNNSGCDTDGFEAAEGWDPASGWGVPWFPRFKEMALQRKTRTQRPWYWYI